MTTFIGDYHCKVDPKGRVMFPATLKKQLKPASVDKFVIKKDIFEKCLIIYPMDEWERQNSIIRKKINPYNKEHAMFLRRFYMGTAEVVLDGNNRMLIPKRLLDEAGITKEIVLAGQNGRIEMWDKASYESMDIKDDDFAALAEKIMGGTLFEDDE